MTDPRKDSWTIAVGDTESSIIDLDFLHICGFKIDSAGQSTATQLGFFESDNADGSDADLVIGLDGVPLVVDLSSVQAPGSGFTAGMVDASGNRVCVNPGTYVGLRYTWCALLDASFDAVAAATDPFVVKPILRDYS